MKHSCCTSLRSWNWKAKYARRKCLYDRVLECFVVMWIGWIDAAGCGFFLKYGRVSQRASVCFIMIQVGALLFDQINVAQQCLDANSDLSDPSVPPVSLLIRDAKRQFDITVLTGTRRHRCGDTRCH
jgi:hypothetical protein